MAVAVRCGSCVVCGAVFTTTTTDGPLDRIDNDGPYAPDNCRWATPTEQRLNARAKS